MNKIDWTAEERIALRDIANTSASLVKTRNNPKVSIRLYGQGYVFKDKYGQLRLTDKGKALLRSF